MRLIDVDKIPGAFLITAIAEAPTVDAIPVEWIQRWWDANYKYADVEVGDLLNDWRAERREKDHDQS